MFSSNTPVQTCRKSLRAFTNQLVNRNNTHNQQPHTQQHQQDRQPPSEELINTNGQKPQATVNNNGIGGQLKDQQLPLASLILGHRSRINPRLPRPSNLPTVPLSYAYGLSASSHAKSHDLNKSFGWWKKFIGHGPNNPIDLDWYFVICKNVLGSCYGSTRPSSINPETNEPMGPISQSSQSLTRVGSSMGGMQSIVTAWLKPQRTQRMVSISGCGRTGPSSIALQYAQRSALLLIIAIDPIVISSDRASQPLPSPTFNILKRDFQAW
ncbi:Alpha/Beta hydrolase protein [Phakopsora pachyrhizi]|nr:Alpha/Beta hydrolase protein [Phakopsora pachyrhizi]